MPDDGQNRGRNRNRGGGGRGERIKGGPATGPNANPDQGSLPKVDLTLTLINELFCQESEPL